MRSFRAAEDDGFSADSARGLDEPGATVCADLAAGADGGADARPDGGAEPAGGAGSPADTYWTLSRTPLTSLAFTLPLVLAYEGGVLALGRGSPRNGADVWLRQLLDALGFGGYFLLPVLMIVGLLAWHHVRHDPWRVSPAVLLGMCLECLVLAGVLVGIARLQGRLWPIRLAADAAGPLADGPAGLVARFVGCCGAGLYEEVLFRLLLLPAVAWGLRRLGGSDASAGGWALVATSLLFAAAHYVGPLGDVFEPRGFVFRALAGGFFALLFVVRGFGIAAGTHAAYDMFVGLR